MFGLQFSVCVWYFVIFCRYVRSTIVSLACGNDIVDCKNESVNLFAEWMRNPDNNPYVV